MLNGVAERNEIKGIKMSADQRLNYDLSILVNKYDSYLNGLKTENYSIRKEIEKVKILFVKALDILHQIKLKK